MLFTGLIAGHRAFSHALGSEDQGIPLQFRLYERKAGEPRVALAAEVMLERIDNLPPPLIHGAFMINRVLLPLAVDLRSATFDEVVAGFGEGDLV